MEIIQKKATTVAEEMCPVDLLERPKTSLLNYLLSRFVMEARRLDRKPYPPTTISNMLAGL